MNSSQTGESFAGIIVGIFILSFVILGIANILTYNRGMSASFQDDVYLSLLHDNFSNIVGTLDTNNIIEGDTLYIHKNTTLKSYDILTGALNENYKYINSNGELIDNVSNYPGNVYTHNIILEKIDTSLGVENRIFNITVSKYK